MRDQRYRLKQQARSGHVRKLGVALAFWGILMIWLGKTTLAQTEWPGSLIEPQGWVQSNDHIVCQTEVTDLEGLLDVAEYRFTTTGEVGIDASPWISDNLQIGGIISTTKTISVTNLTLPDSADRNWIQFRCKHLDGLFRASPVYRVLVDATFPENPDHVGSTSHTVERWSSNNVIEMAWSGASDETSLIFGYSYLWDTSPSTIPDEAADPANQQASSGQLADSNAHYFHLRTRDNARNWTTDAVHSGPYYVDITPPGLPASVSSTTHTPGQWSGENIIQVGWNAADDNLSGIDAYWYAWDTTADTIPENVSTTLHLATSPETPDSDSVWFHLRTMDNAENWSDDTSHLGPFQIDTTPPTLPTTFESSHTIDAWSNRSVITITWEAATDEESGVAGYSFVWDQSSDTLPQPAVVTTNTNATSPQLAHGTHNYFHLRAADNAGNWSGAAHWGPFHIDTQAPTPPAEPSAEPVGWSNVDAFTVRWAANPPDPSQIGAAYAKLGSPPTSNDDYDLYVVGDNITAIPNISVGSDGIHYIYVWLEDKALNSNHLFWGSPYSPFRLDRVSPETHHALDREPDHGEWYTDTVTVNLDSSDGLSRVSVISYTIDGGAVQTLSESGFVVDTEGDHQIQYYATDRAGNVEQAHTISPSVKIDLSPPVSSLGTVNGSPGMLGWFTSTVSIGLRGVDSASGVSSIFHRQRLIGGSWSDWEEGETFSLTAEGQYEIQHYATDNAGYIEAVQTVDGNINIDLIPPTTSHSLTGISGQNGWFKASPVKVTLLPSDAMSGVGETQYRIDANSWQTWSGNAFDVAGEGLHVIEFFSSDVAGNTEAISRTTVGVDTVAPVLFELPELTPAGTWHNDSSEYVLSWQSPPGETSGVVGAYYKFGPDQPQSNSDYDSSCVDTKFSTQCRGLNLVAEGRLGIWVWLVDKAGNTDYRTRRYLPGIIWYDATSPRTDLEVLGTKQGLWYNSSVTLNFSASDPAGPGANAVSGVKVISCSIGYASPWNACSQIVLEDEGTTTVYYRSEDNAGNVEGTRNIRINIDRTPPPSPEDVEVTPIGWATSDRFTLSWHNPSDFTISGAYYSHQEPTSANDGTLIPGSDTCLGTCQAQITIPAQGCWDLYLWLKDAAGNSGWEAPYYIADAFCFDVTSPTANHSVEGQLGRDGWYVSPIQVNLIGQDNVLDPPSLLYRLRQPPDQIWGAWQPYVGPIAVSRQGDSTIRYYARDDAGNESDTKEFGVRIDSYPPYARIRALSGETPANAAQVDFGVGWSGQDPTPGSGLVGFGVQARDGFAGQWVSWLSGTQSLSSVFAGSPGHVYYFRAQARDVAGNISALSGTASSGDQKTYVQSVVNGDFEMPGLVGWEGGGPLWARSVPYPSYHNNELRPMALLGRPELGEGYDQQNRPTVPIGYGAITQTITIPSLKDLTDPMLSFWYRVYSYDVVSSSDGFTLFDSLDVYLLKMDGTEIDLVLRDGDYSTWPKAVPLGDTGWKHLTYSLAQYAGQTLRLRFQCWSRKDTPEPIALSYYNTWAYIDEIRVYGQLHDLQLPAILKNR